MIRRYRRLIALTLIPIVLNALGVSVGTAALADESESVRAVAALFDAETDGHTSSPEPDHFGKNCNHGCHVGGHLLGQVCGTVTHSAAASVAGILSALPLILPVSQPDNPFRPPRTSSLA